MVAKVKYYREAWEWVVDQVGEDFELTGTREETRALEVGQSNNLFSFYLSLSFYILYTYASIMNKFTKFVSVVQRGKDSVLGAKFDDC